CDAGASDIHFEPLEKGLIVRYRIDGVLQQRHTPSRDIQNQLLTRIKVLSKLDIAEHRLPQDGRVKLKLGGRDIDFRISTVPVAYGERIVLRILDKGNVTLGLDKIGMPDVKAFKRCISQSQGIVLVTGPTGSGKTTTLYSALSELQTSEINIMTIEDPVEYKLPGMAQIGVNTKIGLTFAKGLRHILRQDPDVVMIGEIRDKETAEIAIQASLTGHLVLTTLHTNDAPSAITRLVDMGIEPYLLSSSVIGALAQRLVRQICADCKESYTPSEEELLELGIKRKELKNGKLMRGIGCPKCFGSGYRGRCGLYELMPITPAIKRQLLESADAGGLQRIALEDGMISLRARGAKLAISGVTSSAEVLRVTRQIEL
ncbi:MAG TPA: GspE/PulE family protein, partial [Chlamydiales bacterium]|nr:GspE/PulE family protein [Chlamydiales bacterium]